MNKKCQYCGFINFVTAEVCRKCEATLTPADDYQNSSYGAAPTYRGGVNTSRYAYPTSSGFSAGKAVALVLVGLVLLSGFSWVGLRVVSRRSKVKWIEYHPDGQDFTVMVPNEPTRLEPVLTPLAGGNMSNHVFVSGVPGQGTAMFCYIDYTGGLSMDKTLVQRALEAELNGFLERTKSTLISKTPITYQGMQGLEFELKPPANAGSKGYGKMFLTMSRMYFFSITADEGTDLLAGKDKFLNPQIRATFSFTY